MILVCAKFKANAKIIFTSFPFTILKLHPTVLFCSFENHMNVMIIVWIIHFLLVQVICLYWLLFWCDINYHDQGALMKENSQRSVCHGEETRKKEAEMVSTGNVECSHLYHKQQAEGVNGSRPCTKYWKPTFSGILSQQVHTSSTTLNQATNSNSCPNTMTVGDILIQTSLIIGKNTFKSTSKFP